MTTADWSSLWIGMRIRRQAPVARTSSSVAASASSCTCADTRAPSPSLFGGLLFLYHHCWRDLLKKKKTSSFPCKKNKKKIQSATTTLLRCCLLDRSLSLHCIWRLQSDRSNCSLLLLLLLLLQIHGLETAGAAAADHLSDPAKDSTSSSQWLSWLLRTIPSTWKGVWAS